MFDVSNNCYRRHFEKGRGVYPQDEVVLYHGTKLRESPGEEIMRLRLDFVIKMYRITTCKHQVKIRVNCQFYLLSNVDFEEDGLYPLPSTARAE